MNEGITREQILTAQDLADLGQQETYLTLVYYSYGFTSLVKMTAYA